MQDMPLKDFLRVLDEEITPHVDPREVLIIFSGGEVLLREDLEEAGKEVTRRGYPWGMVTNAMALSEKRLASLVEAGLKSITISIDGFRAEHLYVRRHAESFDRAMMALSYLRNYPQLAFDVVTCVTPAMVPKLDAFKEVLIREGVPAWRLFSIFPAGRAKEDKTLQLSPEELKKVLDFIRSTRREGRIDLSYACEGFLGNYESEVRDHFYQCAAGVSVASIRVDGSISGCTSIRANYHQGNIYRDRFWEVWQKRFEPFRDRSWTQTGKCAACDMWRYCQGGGMHLRDEQGELMYCHYEKLKQSKK